MEHSNELDELSWEHGTDKSSGWHDYARHYQRHLDHLKDKEFTLLELGVGPEATKGASLFMWRDFFQHARIVGVDIRPDARDVERDRIVVEIGDCSEPAFLEGLIEAYDPTVVLDDASHIWSHQILSLRTIIPLLRSGTQFIMEDLHTSFGAFRKRPVFADQALDTGDLVLALAAGVVGSGKDHPRFADFELTDADHAVIRRISEIALVRSSAIMRIEDVPVSPASMKVY